MMQGIALMPTTHLRVDLMKIYEAHNTARAFKPTQASNTSVRAGDKVSHQKQGLLCLPQLLPQVGQAQTSRWQ